uniref:Uncharacterized protein n=1 Tax=mine drainage metagenome TaxID=410659 RepID=E6QWB3_9ZZZZ
MHHREIVETPQFGFCRELGIDEYRTVALEILSGAERLGLQRGRVAKQTVVLTHRRTVAAVPWIGVMLPLVRKLVFDKLHHRFGVSVRVERECRHQNKRCDR